MDTKLPLNGSKSDLKLGFTEFFQKWELPGNQQLPKNGLKFSPKMDPKFGLKLAQKVT